MTPPELRYPPDLHFTCSRCGDCCSGWNVMLGPGERDALVRLQWEPHRPELAGVAPSRKIGTREALARREDGSCIFLGPERQCLIHEHFGEEHKPLMCRLFPFGFVPVSGQVAVDVSFACRAVSEDLGAPLSERVPEWLALVGERTGAGDASDADHPFSSKYRVKGELLWELEHAVVSLLSGRAPFVERLRNVSEFMRLATGSDPRTDAARTLREVMLSGIPKQMLNVSLPRERMDKSQRAVFFHLLFLMLNPTPDSLLELSGKRKAREVRLRVQAADAHKFEAAHPWIENRQARATFGEVAGVSPGWIHTDAGTQLVERFFVAKIVGQRFMREGETEIAFVAAVPRLLLLYPMLLWTAKALAAEASRPAVAPDDARRALRILDRSYGEVALSALPTKQRKAWEFVLSETDLPLTATVELGAYTSA